MTSDRSENQSQMEALIVGLYNVLFDGHLDEDDIELYELTEEYYEGEIYLPYIGLNFEQWEEWPPEKRIEVLIHEFAHTENYEDDHHPDFWDRVVELTDLALDHQSEIEQLFGDIDPDELKRTVVDSIHEYVIEEDIETVSDRKQAVSDALNVTPEHVS